MTERNAGHSRFVYNKATRTIDTVREPAPPTADEIERLRAALTEISKGEGAFSRDRLVHATNTIESMKQIALDALRGSGERRHKLQPGECTFCDREKGTFHPSHDASDRCESGKRTHCSCDCCF